MLSCWRNVSLDPPLLDGFSHMLAYGYYTLCGVYSGRAESVLPSGP